MFAYEVRNVLLKGVRRDRITIDDARTFLNLLGELPIQLIDPPDYDAVFETGRSRGLNMYDAAYLELTLRLGVPLATLDSALAAVAASAGAAVFNA